jgi:hypothetical protein
MRARAVSAGALPGLYGEYVLRRVEYHYARTRPAVIASGFVA